MASDPPMHAESSSQRNDTGQGRSWGNINSGSSVRFQLGFPLGAGRGRDGAGRGRDGAGRGRGGAGRGGAVLAAGADEVANPCCPRFWRISGF